MTLTKFGHLLHEEIVALALLALVQKALVVGCVISILAMKADHVHHLADHVHHLACHVHHLACIVVIVEWTVVHHREVDLEVVDGSVV